MPGGVLWEVGPGWFAERSGASLKERFKNPTKGVMKRRGKPRRTAVGTEQRGGGRRDASEQRPIFEALRAEQEGTDRKGGKKKGENPNTVRGRVGGSKGRNEIRCKVKK